MTLPEDGVVGVVVVVGGREIVRLLFLLFEVQEGVEICCCVVLGLIFAKLR